MESIFSLRITPHPAKQESSGYSIDYIVKLFLNKDKFSKLMFFKEGSGSLCRQSGTVNLNTPHLHAVIHSHISESGIRKWIKKWLPKLKGNAYFQLHNCSKCTKKKHDSPCNEKAYYYVAKEGSLVGNKAFSEAELCEYVAKGKELAMTARLTANDSRRLLWIGERFQKDRNGLAKYIQEWYEKQNQCPPGRMHIDRIIRNIFYKYDADYRLRYDQALKEHVRYLYNNIL